MAIAWQSLVVSLLLPLANGEEGTAPRAAIAQSPPSRLLATVHGGAGQVSGSLAVLDTGNGRWMIDCGSHAPEGEGVKLDRQRRATESSARLPVSPRTIDALFLTHAHTDHVGRIPLLVEGGFRGSIYLTEPTLALLPAMLRMQIRFDEGRVRSWRWSAQSAQRAASGGRPLSVHWHADCPYSTAISEANLRSARCSLEELERRFQARDHMDESRADKPLAVPPTTTGSGTVKLTICHRCTEAEVAAVMRLCRAMAYQHRIEPAAGVSATFYYAGHIPGSASVLFEVALPGKTRRVLFSGDVGNHLSPLLPGPEPAPEVDAVFVETTYGDTIRDPSVHQERALFRRSVAEAVGRGDVAWIPVFALDRTQKILYELRLAEQEGLLPAHVPIYCPSSTALEITAIYRQHQKDWFTPEAANDPLAWSPSGLRQSGSTPNRIPRPCILLTTSGMLDNGWSRKLVEQLVPEPSTVIFLVGYQDPMSPGGMLKLATGLMRPATRDQASLSAPAGKLPQRSRPDLATPAILELDGQKIPIRATVESYRCFSAHGDAKEMDAWLGRNPRTAAVILVHGGPEELRTRAAQLAGQGWTRVVIAQPGSAIDLAGAVGTH